MIARILSVVAVCLMLGTLGLSSGAHAYCKIGEATNLPGGSVPQFVFDISGDASIPVYLVAPNGTVLGQSPASVGNAIGRAVEAINRYSYSGARLSYEGQVSALPTSASYGIFIREDASCNACGTGTPIACTKPPLRKADPNFVQNILIHMIYNPGSCPQHNWAFYPDFSATDDIQAVVTHEILHALGLAHAGNAGNCPTKMQDVGSDGIMATFGSSFTDQRYLSQDDAEALIDLYGPRFGELDYQWSTDGLTWTDGNLLNDQWSVSAVGSASTALGNETTMAFSYRAVIGYWVPQIQSMLLGAAGVPAHDLNTTPLWDPPAAANGNGILMVGALGLETETDRSKTVQFHRSADSGTTWSVFNNATTQTVRDGVSIAYEPGTGRFVLTYLGDTSYNLSANLPCTAGGNCDQVRFLTVKADGTGVRSTALTDAGGIPIRSAAAPMVACGPASIGTNNCVVAWVATTANACINWGHFDVTASGTVTLFNILNSPCYPGFSPPFMMFENSTPLDNKPFRMSFTQEGAGQNTTVHTLRKAVGAGTLWADPGSYTVTPWRILGGYGGLMDGGNEMTRSIHLRHAD